MWSHRKPRDRRSDPEAMLRAYRARPRDEFVDSLSRELARERTARRPTAWSRLAFASAASTLIVGVFASMGGLSYAASGATSTYSAVKQIVVEHKLQVNVHKSSAADEYPTTPTAPPEQNVANSNASNAQVAGVATAKTLPFTGISLLATVLLGSALLGLGLILRRRERSDS